MSAHHAVVDFFSNWSIYRAVIEQNCMEHHEISAALHGLLSRRAGSYCLLDLGCGDAAAIGPAMRGTPVSRYVGVDCAAPALDFARATLTGSGAQLDLRVGQLVDAVETLDTSYDVILASFVLHHLDSAAKRRFLAAAKRRLAPDGELLLIDVVRRDGETRQQYCNRYDEVVSGWPIGGDKQAAIMTHVRGFDHPEEVSTMPAWAAELGFAAIETFYSGGSDTQRGWRLMA
ncbi:MAG: class I SAM-dependent methyltransferase [Thiohalocapsa sp.]